MKICVKNILLILMQLSEKEIEEIYGTRHIGRDQARKLAGLMDFFCFSEVGFSVIALFVCMGSESDMVGFLVLT